MEQLLIPKLCKMLEYNITEEMPELIKIKFGRNIKKFSPSSATSQAQIRNYYYVQIIIMLMKEALFFTLTI